MTDLAKHPNLFRVDPLDVEWLIVSWRTKLDLAQRIYDAIVPPRLLTRELETLMGVSMEFVEFLAEDGRVVDVFVSADKTEEEIEAWLGRGKPWQDFGDVRKLQGYNRDTAKPTS